MKLLQKQERMSILEKISKVLHGSGIDQTWRFDETSQGIWMKNSFHCMDDHGGYCGWADFSFFFPWSEKLIEFTLRFHGPRAQYLARRRDLRGYLEDSLVYHLPDETAPGVLLVMEGSPNE